ncbi:MAG: D-alanyl-D-alanine carboxypeptidase family protein [Sporichthyaceae bacterium]
MTIRLVASTLAVLALGVGPAVADVSPTPAPAIAPPDQTVLSAAIGGPRMGEPGLVVAPGALPLPALSAATWLVADAGTGAVLAASNPHGKRRPASTLKTLTALTMAPRLDPNDTYTSQADDELVEGTRVGMLATQTYSIRDLWYALFLRSANDAANSLAKAGGDGTLETGVRMIQAEAVRLQALDTTVVNPSGLDADGQYSSAYDLALWGRAALGRGDLRHYMGTLRRQFPGNLTKTGTAKTRQPFWIYTTNRLIGKYDGIVGVKNGYTTFARNTLIAAAERDGRTIVATLMGAPGLVHEQAAKLLDWGFATAADAPSVGQLVDPISTAVVGPDDVAGNVAEQAATLHAEPAAAEGSPAARHTDLRVAAVGGAVAGLFLVGVLARRFRTRRR